MPTPSFFCECKDIPLIDKCVLILTDLQFSLPSLQSSSGKFLSRFHSVFSRSFCSLSSSNYDFFRHLLLFFQINGKIFFSM